MMHVAAVLVAAAAFGRTEALLQVPRDTRLGSGVAAANATAVANLAEGLASAELGGHVERLAAALHLEAVTEKIKASVNSKGPVPEKGCVVKYTETTCDTLFAYADTRVSCKRLQAKICGKECKVVAAGQVAECESIQDTICYVPKFGPVPEPTSTGSAVPRLKKAVVVTFCNARSTGPIGLWAATRGGGAKEVVPELDYLECVQLHGWNGLEVGVTSSGNRLASEKLDEHNSIVLVGQSGIDDRDASVWTHSFKDEGYLRPILCNLAYHESTFEVKVAGRDWYPFVIRGDMTKSNRYNEGKLPYLQCELLTLDHCDSLRERETLTLTQGKDLIGVVPVDPVKTLFLIGSEGKPNQEVLFHRSVNLGHLKY